MISSSKQELPNVCKAQDIEPLKNNQPTTQSHSLYPVMGTL